MKEKLKKMDYVKPVLWISKKPKTILQKPRYCSWCREESHFVFKKNYEHWEDNEHDDVWVCTSCNTIHGEDFFEFHITDIEHQKETEDNIAANSFGLAVQG